MSGREPSSSVPAWQCPVCGTRMEGYHCKLTCRNCGYQEDCSDLFQAGPVEIPQPPPDPRRRPDAGPPEDD